MLHLRMCKKSCATTLQSNWVDWNKKHVTNHLRDWLIGWAYRFVWFRCDSNSCPKCSLLLLSVYREIAAQLKSCSKLLLLLVSLCSCKAIDFQYTDLKVSAWAERRVVERWTTICLAETYILVHPYSLALTTNIHTHHTSRIQFLTRSKQLSQLTRHQWWSSSRQRP